MLWMFVSSNIEFGELCTILGISNQTQFFAKNMFTTSVMYMMFYTSIMVMSFSIRVKNKAPCPWIWHLHCSMFPAPCVHVICLAVCDWKIAIFWYKTCSIVSSFSVWFLTDYFILLMFPFMSSVLFFPLCMIVRLLAHIYPVLVPGWWWSITF